MNTIRDNLEMIEKTLREGVTLVVVSKTHPPEAVMAAYEEGVRDFGENRVQELESKYEVLPKDIRWHLIGHLQTNKVRKIIGKTHLIQSLDREALAREIEKRAAVKDIVVDALIEVNIGEEEQKAGILMKDLDGFLEVLKPMTHIRIRGLMAIIPQGTPEENRGYFKKMHALYQKLKEREHERMTMEILSMGMSGDYLEAMEEGSGMVRIGTAVFGSRAYNEEEK